MATLGSIWFDAGEVEVWVLRNEWDMVLVRNEMPMVTWDYGSIQMQAGDTLEMTWKIDYGD